MDYNNNKIENLQEVLDAVHKADLPPLQSRDMTSAIKRICEMAGMAPAAFPAKAPAIRATLAKIRPAAHGVSHKTWANLLSLFRAALKSVGVIDPLGQGTAMQNEAWAPLVKAIADDKRQSCGLATFANFCVARNISPRHVNDTVVQQFLGETVVRVTVPWVQIPPSPPYPIDLQGFYGLFVFQGTNGGPRLTLSLRPGDQAAILPKLNPGFKTYAPTPVRRSSTPRRALKTYMRACPSE